MKVEIVLKDRDDEGIYLVSAMEDPVDCIAECPMCPEDEPDRDLEWDGPEAHGVLIGAFCPNGHEFIRQDTPMAFV